MNPGLQIQPRNNFDFSIKAYVLCIGINCIFAGFIYKHRDSLSPEVVYDGNIKQNPQVVI